jgi:hypothetical protein
MKPRLTFQTHVWGILTPNQTGTEDIKFRKVNLSTKDYLIRALPPLGFSEFALLPGMRIYAKQPKDPESRHQS